MAFKLTKTPTYVQNVTVETPNSKGGWDKEDLRIEFERVDVEELDSLRQLTNVKLLERVIKGWENVKDEQNQAVEFNDVNKAVFLTITPAVVAAAQSFWESQYRAKAKN